MENESKGTQTHYSIEHVDAQIEALKAKYEAKSTVTKEGANAHELKLNDICKIVNIAVPILTFVRGFLFFKPAWQKILDQVIGASAICSGSE